MKSHRDGPPGLLEVEWGMAHITGTDRAQVLLPPDTVDDYVGPDFPSPLDEQLTWKKTIQLTLAALLGLSGALPAAATEYQASDYLPLAVGNSWTYDHDYYDIEKRFGDYDQWSAYFAQESSEFTIEVLRTEELDGQTYYVISEMPSNWPPAPPPPSRTPRMRGTMCPTTITTMTCPTATATRGCRGVRVTSSATSRAYSAAATTKMATTMPLPCLWGTR